MNNLTSCPFCGGKPEVVKVYDGWKAIFCPNCKTIMRDYSTEEAAINAWNRRFDGAVNSD